MLVFSFMVTFIIFEQLEFCATQDEGAPPARQLQLKDVQPSQAQSDNFTAVEESMLQRISNYAKKISYSKGPFMKSDENETMHQQDLDLRRSIIRKASINADSGILKDLLYSFYHNTGDKLMILKVITDLVHQYDVALRFVNMGGIEFLIPLLSSQDDGVVAAAISVLGTAMQGNPVVQKVAVQFKLGDHLMKLLREKSPDFYSSTLFALSSYLRNMPEAQEVFLSKDDVDILSQILDNHVVSTNTKLKIISIFSDLTQEHELAKMYQEGNVTKYEELQRLFTFKVRSSKICHLIPVLLFLEDFDTHHRVVVAMNSLYPICSEYFNTDEILARVSKLISIYHPIIENANPLYPVIDTELKQMIYGELKMLYLRIGFGVVDTTQNPEFMQYKDEL